MRYSFGGDLSSWAYTTSGSTISPAGNTTITFWDSQSGGAQYTDLAGAVDGSLPTTSIVTSDGSGGQAVGNIPRFYGPDGIAVMWAEVAGQPRRVMVANDAPMLLAGAQVVTGAKSFGPSGNVNDSRLVLYAELTGQIADLVTAWSGTDTGQDGQRQRTFYLNEKGELRVICAKANSVGVRVKGQPGQTQHVLEQTDTGNTAISWWEPNGSWRAPNLGHLLVVSVPGTLVVGTGKHRIYNDTGVPLTIRAVRASVGTAPTGASLIVDVHKNAVTIFTTQANRPTIAASGNTAKVTNMNVTSIADGEYLTVDVDQIGSTVAGADLTVQVLCY